MRLLHTTKLRFEEFNYGELPRFAILSHRWGLAEVSYQDFLQGRMKDGPGYAKIVALCKLAAADTDTRHWSDYGVPRPFEWVWIDTCCIDKSSSAELSEAVNSMYYWYSKAVVCYAYLSDVKKATEHDLTMKAFERSQWFHRGWTLQELLVPTDVVFFSNDWTRIGTRDTLKANIVTATGISNEAVTDFHSAGPNSVSTAEKLSWMSVRMTSRVEDQAYCLLGLFNINMPLVYGEGPSALRRFKLEILRSTNDESIFISDLASRAPSGVQVVSVGLLDRKLGYTPIRYHHYENGNSLTLSNSWISSKSRPPYTVTNQGLELRVPKRLAMKEYFFLPLNRLVFENGQVRGVFAIILSKNNDRRPGTWYRSFCEDLPESLPKLPPVEYDDGPSSGLFIAPEAWLWSREQLDEMERTTIIYVNL